MTAKENLVYSVNPAGEKFPLPQEKDYATELARIENLVAKARKEKKEIVVVMGLGFVGAVMAAIVADTKDKKGHHSKFVIGCQRPSNRSYWKIGMMNKGLSPVKAEDPEVEELIDRCVLKKKTLVATYNSDCLRFADCVVVDVQCDFSKKELGNMRSGEADMAALEDTMRTIGEKIRPECLVLIETTVAPGTTEFVAWPILRKNSGNGGSMRRLYCRIALKGSCREKIMWHRSGISGGFVRVVRRLHVKELKNSFMKFSIQRIFL